MLYINSGTTGKGVGGGRGKGKKKKAKKGKKTQSSKYQHNEVSQLHCGFFLKPIILLGMQQKLWQHITSTC